MQPKETAPSENLDQEVAEHWRRICRGIGTIAKATAADVEGILDAIREAHDMAEMPAETKIETSPLHAILPSVLSTWMTDPSYSDQNGDPLEIPLSADGPSISDLLERAARTNGMSVDDTLLDEAAFNLLSSNSVEKSADGGYRILTLAYIFLSTDSVHAVPLLRGLAAYIDTTVLNLRERDNRTNGSFQRFAWSANFPRKNVKVLKGMMDQRAMDLLTDIDSYLTEADGLSPEDTKMAGAGIYLYIEED